MTQIRRRRPAIPAEYGVDQDDAGMLDWDDVTATLKAAPIYWISSVTPEGAPHLIPIWGGWTADAGFIEGGAMTKWARNLSQNPQVHLGVDHDGRQVMVRGTASQVDVDENTQRAIADVYEAKHPYRPTGTTFWKISPVRVLAWNTNDLEAFGRTPTEFAFEEET